jgi:hypothetical protein
LGTYQLLIAPVVLQRRDAYEHFFQVHDDQFIIIDNGVIELGFPLPARELYKAAALVNAQLVVMPDTIDDGKMTVKQVRLAIEDFRKLDHATDTMGVVQGTTFEECMECARQLVDLGVDWLGVPKGLTPNLGSRVPLVQALASEYDLPMHILGFTDQNEDDIMAAVAHRLVRGIDAATPIWSPMQLGPKPMRPTESQALGRRPANFWTSGGLGSHAHENVRTVRQWLNDAQAAPTAKAGRAPQSDQPTQNLSS